MILQLQAVIQGTYLLGTVPYHILGTLNKPGNICTYCGVSQTHSLILNSD